MTERRIFKPADGAQAAAFERAWCESCERHDGHRGISSGCWILFAASIYDAEDSAYPEAWIIGASGPECTAMEPALRAVGFDRVAFEQQGFAKGDGRDFHK